MAANAAWEKTGDVGGIVEEKMKRHTIQAIAGVVAHPRPNLSQKIVPDSDSMLMYRESRG